MVKRCFELNSPTTDYFNTPNAAKDAGVDKQERFRIVQGIVVTGRPTWMVHMKVVAALLRPLMHKLRLADGTANNMYPDMMMHLVDLRSTLVNAWVDHADLIKSVLEVPGIQWQEGLDETQAQVDKTLRHLVNKWTLAAHLLNPHNVVLYQ
eukprot:11202161-Lingulodinium_polyedra.AAC.1